MCTSHTTAALAAIPFFQTTQRLPGTCMSETGLFSGAHQFCHVGAHSFLGMFAGTSRDVPAYTMVAGQPATVRGINLEGLKRRNFTPEQISNIKKAYRIVYRKGTKLPDAIRQVEELAKTQPELEIFAKSLHTSDRGLLR
jgi:UDP-N-acetylglucosamine acyltransferase